MISKKELLAVTGISYGQLYRWKREKLIPEEWFIKQSAYTGQETFFPREQILSRVQTILDNKDRYSLEELARMLSSEQTGGKLEAQTLAQFDEVDTELARMLVRLQPRSTYELYDLALLSAVTQALQSGSVAREETEPYLERVLSASAQLRLLDTSLLTIALDGTVHALILRNPGAAVLDQEIQILHRADLRELANALQIKYKSTFTLK
ncbi:MAG: YhbD family protein [Clostridiales bacterium]|nr:YhbD family protein [Clostridiales bacterium]